MANTTTIILKNSGSSGNIPTSQNLQFGELAINYADGILYYKSANGSILRVGESASVSNDVIAAFNQANNANIYAFGAHRTANAAFVQANVARTHANAAFEVANVAGTSANLTIAWNQSNSSFIHANAAFLQANNANIYAFGAHRTSNSAQAHANAAFLQANNANIYAFGAHRTANAAFVQANNAYTHANGAHVTANAAFLQANNANIYAFGAHVTANAAFEKANAAFPSTGGTIIGDVSISGNLTVIGNSTVFNVSSLVINDPLIFLGNNNYSSDLVDIGFVGHYNDGANAHTGFVRDATSKEYFLFNGYTPEIFANDIINIAHPSFALTNVNANYYKGNLISNTAIITISATIAGINIVPTLASSFTHANAAHVTANAAFGVANAAGTSANLNFAFTQANSAHITANAAFEQANVARIHANAAFEVANVAGGSIAYAHANAAFLQANNANIYAFGAHVTANAAFEQANVARIHANAAFTRANQQTNLAFSTIVANGISLVADSNADTLTILTSGNVAISADAAGDNLTFDLTTTGVTAAIYGNSTIVPVFTVDARGRITSVTNTTISVSGSGPESDTLQTVTNRGNTTANIIVITNNSSSVSNSTGALRVTGGVGVTGNIYVGSSSVIGYSNANSISVVYQYYNSVTNSLDTVFG
jgi:hypothetical protein